MSYIVAFTPEAQEQLLELYRYIAAAASPMIAKKLYQRPGRTTG